ncbi:MAG: TDP-N-acetylfucosamine:lipid II N-acetylfucosaminyltransferase [Weeksellaceae bacterium]
MLPKEGNIEYCKFPCRNIFNLDLNTANVIEQINSYDLLCIEFLNPKFYDIIDHKNLNTPILWIGWGGDYYWLIDSSRDFNLLLPRTKKLITKFPNNFLPNRLAKQLKKIKRQRLYQSIQNIDYFSPPIPVDYEAIKANYPSFKPTYFQWNYGYINDKVLDQFSSMRTRGSKIMIGNSATPSNNHLDVFYNLKSILTDQKLILPLNYGDMGYKTYITQHLSTHFKKENIEILEIFLPSHEFDNKLLDCKNLILGHMRQQALSTIIKALIFGLNVFLFKNSNNYKFLKQAGFHIHTIENLKENPNLLDSNLTPLQIKENKRKIKEIWSLKHNVNQIQELISNL